jgi:hypothetical protein
VKKLVFGQIGDGDGWPILAQFGFCKGGAFDFRYRTASLFGLATGLALPFSDPLRIVAGAARRPALFPQLFPIPELGGHLVRQLESELMREHAHLPAMVRFVRQHVAQHFHANRPRPSPAVSKKRLDAAPTTAERFREHLRAASGALRQSRTRLPRRAVRAIELSRNLQVRSRKPDPLGADVVHVREDRRNRAGLAGRLGAPGGRVEAFDKHLIRPLIGGKDLDCGPPQWSVKLRTQSCAPFSLKSRVNLLVTHGHGSLPPEPIIRPGRATGLVPFVTFSTIRSAPVRNPFNPQPLI